MNFSKRALVLALCLFLSLNAFSQNTQNFPKMEDLFSGDVCVQLKQDGKISKFTVGPDKKAFEYASKTGLAESQVAAWKQARNDTDFDDACYTLENIYRFEATKTQDKAAEMKKLNRVIRSLSKMEGVQYYSNTRRKMDVLYHKAYSIVSVEDRTRVEDDLDGTKNPVYVLLDDNSFGEIVTEVTYGQSGDELFLTNVNKVPMGIWGMNAIKTDDYFMIIDIARCENEIVVYVYLTAKVSVPAMFKNSIYNSFVARADALYGWLESSYFEK